MILAACGAVVASVESLVFFLAVLFWLAREVREAVALIPEL